MSDNPWIEIKDDDCRCGCIQTHFWPGGMWEQIADRDYLQLILDTERWLN